MGSESELPKLNQLLKLLENNLYEFEADDIEAAAIEGLLQKLNGRISLEGREDSVEKETGVRPDIKTRYLENKFVCIQLTNLDQNPLNAIKESLEPDAKEVDYQGLVLDLRFSHGSNYEILPALSGYLLGSNEDLYQSSRGIVTAKQNDQPCRLPIAVLVNNQTTGTAELISAILQNTKRAIVIGNQTQGEVFYFDSIPFAEGKNLKIARGPLSLPSGKILTHEGVKPEITVTVDPEIEFKYFENPYFSNSSASQERVQLNEADLIKIKEHQKDRAAGIHKPFPEDEIREGRTEHTSQTISDPCLARGIDFLKGVQLLRNIRTKEVSN